MKVWIAVFIFLTLIARELFGVREEEIICGCALDVLVGMLRPLPFTLITIVPTIMMSSQITEKDFHYQFSIRHKSWKSILWEQMKKIIVVSVVMAVLFLIAVMLFAYMKKIPLYNWNSFISIFSIRTDKKLELCAFTVYAYAFLCIVVRMILIQNILLLFMWGGQYKIIGIIFVLCITFDEQIRGDRLICRLLSFDYDIWFGQPDRIRVLLQTAVYVCAGILLYKYFLSRKELLHCE